MFFLARRRIHSNLNLESELSSELSNVQIAKHLSKDLYTQMDMIALSTHDLAILRVMRPILKQNLADLVGEFYTNLAKEPSLQNIIRDNSSVDRLQKTLSRHIGEMFDGVIDEQFVQKRQRIASVHAHIGLAPKWYMCAFQNLLNGFYKIIEQTDYPVREQFEIMNAITKILNLEQQIVLELYEHEYEQALMVKNEANLAIVESVRINSASLSEVAAETNEAISSIVAVLEDLKNMSGYNNELSVRVAQSATDEQRRLITTEQNSTELRETMQHVKTDIHDLHDLNKQITDIASLIADIASETNLLSLNASIEAARAGENGKGFAVVASEVRKLSEKTSEAVEKVNQIVSKSLAKTKVVADASTSLDLLVKTSNEDIQITGTSFEKIASHMQELNSSSHTLLKNVAYLNDNIAAIQENTNRIHNASMNLVAECR